MVTKRDWLGFLCKLDHIHRTVVPPPRRWPPTCPNGRCPDPFNREDGTPSEPFLGAAVTVLTVGSMLEFHGICGRGYEFPRSEPGAASCPANYHLGQLHCCS